MIPASPSLATEQPANRKTAIHVFSHGHTTASAAEWPPISPKFQELKKFSTHACDSRPHPKNGCLKLPPDKSSTRCHSDLLPNCQRTFSTENQLRQNHPCGLKPMQTNICRGFKPRPAFDLQNPNVRHVDRQFYRQVARSSSNLVENFQSFRMPPKSPQNAAKNGDDRARTGNLRRARAALSQLSYVPGSTAKFRTKAHDNKQASLRCHAPSRDQPEFRNREWAYVDSNHGPQLYQSCALTN